MSDGAEGAALRLMVYDRTCRGRGPLPGLTHSWWLGARLYRSLGRLDRWHGVGSWAEALGWLAEVEPGREIAEVQFWGHGKWGSARIGGAELDEAVLLREHPLHALLGRVRARLAGPEARWWWRTCETYGAEPGQRFAERWSEHLGCTTAGHTFIIGPWQSGLHALRPGEKAAWSPEEGLLEGSPGAPRRARWSRPGAPNTITCFDGALPGWAFQPASARSRSG